MMMQVTGWMVLQLLRDLISSLDTRPDPRPPSHAIDIYGGYRLDGPHCCGVFSWFISSVWPSGGYSTWAAVRRAAL